jgi:hypothetical protein
MSNDTLTEAGAAVLGREVACMDCHKQTALEDARLVPDGSMVLIDLASGQPTEHSESCEALVCSDCAAAYPEQRPLPIVEQVKAALARHEAQSAGKEQ